MPCKAVTGEIGGNKLTIKGPLLSSYLDPLSKTSNRPSCPLESIFALTVAAVPSGLDGKAKENSWPQSLVIGFAPVESKMFTFSPFTPSTKIFTKPDGLPVAVEISSSVLKLMYVERSSSKACLRSR